MAWGARRCIVCVASAAWIPPLVGFSQNSADPPASSGWGSGTLRWPAATWIQWTPRRQHYTRPRLPLCTSKWPATRRAAAAADTRSPVIGDARTTRHQPTPWTTTVEYSSASTAVVSGEIAGEPTTRVSTGQYLTSRMFLPSFLPLSISI